MLFLKSWLEDYIDLAGIEDIALANMISLGSSEVEEVKVIDDYYNSMVKVGKIANVKKHPDADSLQYFDVLLGGDQKVKICSAANNVREGLIVPVALVGANFGGFVVSTKKMRGIESQGVCLGKSELNLETSFSPGLWELNDIVDESKIGMSICEAIPNQFPKDSIFDIKILPDKISKIGNHMGMAIEIAIVLKDLKRLKSFAKMIAHNDLNVAFNIAVDTIKIKESNNKISLEDNDNYSKAFSLFDIKLPHEFILDCKDRLRMFLTGENTTGTIADLSNYVMLDCGQPSHFFKSETIEGNNLSIRALNEVTKFNGLGQLKEANLPPKTQVLTDKLNILAVPGISGAVASSVSKTDTNITLELASFNDFQVSTNSFLLNYRSPAAKLYCSDVDVFSSLVAFCKIHEVLGIDNMEAKLNYIGGKNMSGQEWLSTINNSTIAPINIDYDYINSRLGTKNYMAEIENALPLIGSIKDNQLTPFNCVSLITTQEDIAREVSRIIGYDALDNEYLPGSSLRIADEQYYNSIRLKELVASYGFYEIATRPFTNTKDHNMIDNHQDLLKLYNPYREGVEHLRSDLNITLLESLSLNVRDGYKVCKIFETAKTYIQKGTEVKETVILGGGLVSDEFNLVTTIVNDLLNRLGIIEAEHSIAVTTIGNKTSYTSNSKEVGSIIEVSNKAKKQFNLPLNKTIILFNINLPDNIINFPVYKKYADESQYPSIRRSYNIFLENTVTSQNIIKEITSVKTDFKVIIDPIERLHINEKQDKLLLSIRYTSNDKTLSNDDILPIENIINNYA
jgi:phenylalanyl-tRNA synthetase beta chain